jgi:hypothetical protein
MKFRQGSIPFKREPEGVTVRVHDFDIVKFVWALHDLAREQVKAARGGDTVLKHMSGEDMVHLTVAEVLSCIGTAVTAAIEGNGNTHERGQGDTGQATDADD